MVATFAFFAACFIVPALYEGFFVGSAQQATPGKWMMGLKVETADGGRLSRSRAFLRGLVKLVVMWLLYPAAGIVFLDPDRRALWDMLLRTRTVSAHAHRGQDVQWG